jgi:hypothetical protein
MARHASFVLADVFNPSPSLSVAASVFNHLFVCCVYEAHAQKGIYMSAERGNRAVCVHISIIIIKRTLYYEKSKQFVKVSAGRFFTSVFVCARG